MGKQEKDRTDGVECVTTENDSGITIIRHFLVLSLKSLVKASYESVNKGEFMSEGVNQKTFFVRCVGTFGTASKKSMDTVEHINK